MSDPATESAAAAAAAAPATAAAAAADAPAAARTKREPKVKAAKEPKAAPTSGPGSSAAAGKEKKKDRSLLGITDTKEGNFPGWYQQVITKAELIEYYDISGCYILRPTAYAVWERIQGFFDELIKESGVQNCYFPLLVSQDALEKEKSHIEGFKEEVAWVTQSGDTKLDKKVALRPTSETVMYPAYAKWIRSHRDLPLRLNQWCNILRWEFKHPVPFLRSREFLWQEGHSAYSNKDDAAKEVLEILDFYRRVYEDVLAVPVVLGRKSEGEKFAGGDYTTTCEAFIPANGRAIQGATSHHLGQNFAKMFNVQFEDHAGKKEYCWQNSWGLTTRTIGVAIMVHGDDKGLVLPPMVAVTQVVLIPLRFKDSDWNAVCVKAHELAKALRAAKFRVLVDDREGHNPGFKFGEHEVRGVPIRLEVGPKDLEAGQVLMVVRDTGAKETVAWDALVDKVGAACATMQKRLFDNAKAVRDSRLKLIHKWDEFVPTLDGGNMCLVPWCLAEKCEDEVKKKSKIESEARKKAGVVDDLFQLSGAAKSLCIPFAQPAEVLPERCFACEAAAKEWALFGRSY